MLENCFVAQANLLQLLEGIGAMSAADSMAAHAVFQEIVTTPTQREADDDAATREDEPDDTQHEGRISTLSAIEKASYFPHRLVQVA